MSKDKQNEFNFTSGRDQQIQIGDGNTQSIVNHGDGTPDWQMPFLELQEQLKGKGWGDTPAPYKNGSDTETYGSPEELVADALAVAATDIEISEKSPEAVLGEPAFAETQTGWYDRFKSLLPLGVKISASVGSAVVDSYVSRSPVIAGLQALFKEVQSATG